MTRRYRRLARTAPGVAAALVLAAVAGCAAMPDSGPVQRSDQGQRTEQDAQVRVYGQRPVKNEQPEQLVNGFLEATTSDEAAYSTARDYLTAAREKAWLPSSRITVLKDSPTLTLLPDPRRADRARVVMAATVVGTVDGRAAYHPVHGGEARQQLTYKLVRDKHGQWRIDDMPAGLVLSQDDFQRIYRPANLFYYASYSDSGGMRMVQAGRPLTVADRIYLRRRDDPASAVIGALLRGPSSWVGPVSQSAFPAGARLARTPSIDDDGTYEVQLRGDALEEPGSDSRSGAQCRLMASQVALSLADLTGADSTEVRLADTGGHACRTDLNTAAQYSSALSSNGGSGVSEYFIADGGHGEGGKVVSLLPSQGEATPVDGPFGDGRRAFRSVGVQRGENEAAAVSADGRKLYVGRIDKNHGIQDVLSSGAGKPPKKASDGLGFTTPTWDAWDSMWVADTTKSGSRVYEFPDPGSGSSKVTVDAPGLEGKRIRALRVSSDGARAALVVEPADPKDHSGPRLLVARIARTSSMEHRTVRLEGFRAVAPQLSDVTAVAWSGANQLVVLGQETRSVQQVFSVDADGSRVTVPPTVGAVPSGVSSVAASDQPKVPLAVDSGNGTMYRQDQSNVWRQVSPKGSQPVFPG